MNALASAYGRHPIDVGKLLNLFKKGCAWGRQRDVVPSQWSASHHSYYFVVTEALWKNQVAPVGDGDTAQHICERYLRCVGLRWDQLEQARLKSLLYWRG